MRDSGLVITPWFQSDRVPGGQTLQVGEGIVKLFGVFGSVLAGHYSSFQRMKLLGTLREAGIDAADSVARNRTGTASLRDLACLGREMVYEVKVVRVLLKVISSSVREDSCVDDMSLSNAPGIEP